MRAIVSLATGAHGELLEIALPTFEAFAARHGYDVIIADVDSDRPPSWRKVAALRETLGEYDAALWLDADTVIVDLDDDVPIANDAWQALVEHNTDDGIVPNCGVWYVRAAMIPTLEEMWRMTRYLNHGWWEQAAMHELLGYGGRPVERLEPTPLRERTTFLDNGWNCHIWDRPEAEHPRILHATMLAERAEAMRAWAAQALA